MSDVHSLVVQKLREFIKDEDELARIIETFEVLGYGGIDDK